MLCWDVLQPLGHAASLLCDYCISIAEFLFSPASNILGVTVYSIHIRSSSADICLSHVVRDLFFWWSYCNFRRYKRQLWKGTFAGAPVRNDYNMRKNDYVIFFTMVNRRIRKQNVTDAMLSVIGWNSEVLWIVCVTYWSILFSHVFNTLKISNMNVSVGGFLHCFWFATVIFPLPGWNRKKTLNLLICKSAGD